MTFHIAAGARTNPRYSTLNLEPSTVLQAREEFEQRARELESVSDALQDKVSSMERGHDLRCRELHAQVQRANDAKAAAELELKQALAHVASLEEMSNGRLKTATKSLEVKEGATERLQREVDDLRKELTSQQVRV